MKTLIKFYTENPGYFKKGLKVIQKRNYKLLPKSVTKFRNSDTYKSMKQSYLKSIK